MQLPESEALAMDHLVEQARSLFVLATVLLHDVALPDDELRCESQNSTG